MKDIQLYYWLGMQNFGDALNIDLCKKLFNINPVMSTPEECEATFIGSTLDDFLFRGLKRFSKKYQDNINKLPVKIWGSGFIAPKNKFCRRLFNLYEQYFRTIEVKAIRGDLSRKRLEKISNQNLDDVLLADAGLLAKDLKTTPIIIIMYRLLLFTYFLIISFKFNSFTAVNISQPFLRTLRIFS